jgi:integrase
MREPHTRIFTDQFLRSLRPSRAPYKRSESAPRGEGRLTVRVLPSGAKELFYRYREGGSDRLLSIGRFDPLGKTGLTLAKARAELSKVRATQRETGDVKAHRLGQARIAAIEARRGSFGQLLGAYVQELRDAGKPSAGAVEGIFRRNVLKPFRTLAETKAGEVGPGDVQRILARLVRAGATREVNKLRSYLRAAFAHGMKADHDPRTVAKDGVLFGLKYNPAASVPRIAEYDRAGNRTLSPEELKAFWISLDALPVVQAATLRLNLALGCQRPTQLLRADWSTFDFSAKTLLLRDSKGRGSARDHLLPITSFALGCLRPLRELNSLAESPFTDDGRRRMAVETLSKAVSSIARTLKEEKGVPRFQMRDLRRTAETMLQGLGVEKEVRAHLLSHGRGQGVQGRHYERYDFLPEKRAALEKWARHLERIISGKAAKVVPLKGAA